LLKPPPLGMVMPQHLLLGSVLVFIFHFPSPLTSPGVSMCLCESTPTRSGCARPHRATEEALQAMHCRLGARRATGRYCLQHCSCSCIAVCSTSEEGKSVS
jgi:hypothetical protein